MDIYPTQKYDAIDQLKNIRDNFLRIQIYYKKKHEDGDNEIQKYTVVMIPQKDVNNNLLQLINDGKLLISITILDLIKAIISNAPYNIDIDKVSSVKLLR